MAKKPLFKVHLSGNGPYGKFIEAELSASVVSHFNKWMQKGLKFGYQAPIGEASEPILTLSSTLCSLSSKQFQNRAEKIFLNRLKDEQYRKFLTGGYRKWAPLKRKTIKIRNYLAIKWNVAPISETTPLLFSGTLATAVMKGLKIDDFSFFSKREWGKGFFKVSNLNILVRWEEPRTSVPWWYFHKTKNAIRKFGDLIEFHRYRGRKPFLSGARDVLLETGEVVETKELTKGEFFRNVWSPFLKEDLPKVFKVEKSDVKEGVEFTFKALNDIMERLDMTESSKRNVYKMIERKQVSAKVALQRLKEYLEKEERGEI